MARNSALLALLSLLPALSLAHPSPTLRNSQTCFPTCRFKLCPSTPLSLSSKPDTPATSPICLPNTSVGVVHLAEALLPASGKPIPISKFRAPGLAQPFSPSFLKAYSLPSGASAVGHEVSQQGQAAFLAGKCVALPVWDYQRLEKGVVVENVRLGSRPLVDCVAVRIANGGVSPGTKPPTTSGTRTTTELPKTKTTTTTTAPPKTKTTTTTTAPPKTKTTTTTTAPPKTKTTTTTTAPPKTKKTTTTTAPPKTKTTTTTTAPPKTKTAKPSKTTTLPNVPPVPKVVDIDDTIEFPPTTKLGEKTTFKFSVTVSADSGSSREDFYLLSDATSSMATAIAEAKEKFLDVVDAREAASSDVAFGVGYYRDENEDDLFVNVQPITSKTSLVTAGINSLTAGSIGNFDTPEANLVALYRVATQDKIGWRDGSRRILVYFGDAPGHEPTCVSGQPRLTREKVIAALKKKKISVVATSLPGGPNSPGLDAETLVFGCSGDDPAPAGQATAITGETGGKIVEAEEQEKLIESILSSVGGLSQELDADISDCEAADVEVSFSPKLPLSIATGKTVTVAETVSVKPGVCGSGGSGFSCKVTFTLSGATVGVQTLKSSGITGC